MTTQAQKFAEIFNDDGMNFEDAQGRHFTDVMENMGVSPEYAIRIYSDSLYDDDPYCYESGYESEHACDDPIRFEFDDGSCIVSSGNAWDFEGDKRFSWKG